MSRIPFEMDQEDVDRDVELLGLKPDTGHGETDAPEYGFEEVLAAFAADLDAPLTPEEESAVARREAVADALLAAEGAANEAGEEALATCLAILGMLLDIGGIAYAERDLVAVRETATKALREQRA